MEERNSKQHPTLVNMDNIFICKAKIVFKDMVLKIVQILKPPMKSVKVNSTALNNKI